jgi:hypothetical protein
MGWVARGCRCPLAPVDAHLKGTTPVAITGERLTDRPIEVGERVRYRSLDWMVSAVSERTITLFGRQPSHQGRTLQAVMVSSPSSPSNAWRHLRCATGSAVRIGTRATGRECTTRSGSHCPRGAAAWGRLVLEP